MENETKSRFKRICVFCGSSSGKKPSYQEAAIELGKELVQSLSIFKISDLYACNNNNKSNPFIFFSRFRKPIFKQNPFMFLASFMIQYHKNVIFFIFFHLNYLTLFLMNLSYTHYCKHIFKQNPSIYLASFMIQYYKNVILIIAF